MRIIETYKGTVYTWHCDFNQHMNVQHYMGKFDEATWHFLAHLGITLTYLQSNGKGMVAVDQHLKYFEEIHAGGLLYITSELLEIKSKAIVFLHRMYNAETDKVITKGRMVGVHIDQKSRKSEEFPEDIRKKMASIIDQKD